MSKVTSPKLEHVKKKMQENKVSGIGDRKKLNKKFWVEYKKAKGNK